jgi:hypothetical protein
MGRVEKTVFVSYRRTDESWGLAVFQNLTQHGYDVFIDYDGIASGNFEAVILENIRARAHFLILLTPTALERCADSKDWMAREIETALDSRRNIVPVMLAGFDFSKHAGQLVGKLVALKEYNGLEILKARYFSSEMERLRNRFLNVRVDVVMYPASGFAQRAAEEQKNKATLAPLPKSLNFEWWKLLIAVAAMLGILVTIVQTGVNIIDVVKPVTDAVETAALTLWRKDSGAINTYAVQKDLIDAFEHIIAVEDQLIQQGKSESLKSELRRSVEKYDSLFEAIETLRNNDGISEQTWLHLLKLECPNFEKMSYSVGDTPLPATKFACVSTQTKWREPPR